MALRGRDRPLPRQLDRGSDGCHCRVRHTGQIGVAANVTVHPFARLQFVRCVVRNVVDPLRGAVGVATVGHICTEGHSGHTNGRKITGSATAHRRPEVPIPVQRRPAIASRSRRGERKSTAVHGVGGMRSVSFAHKTQAVLETSVIRVCSGEKRPSYWSPTSRLTPSAWNTSCMRSTMTENCFRWWPCGSATIELSMTPADSSRFRRR